MIGKHLVKIATKFALRKNDAIRIADGYESASRIGVIYSYSDEAPLDSIGDFIKRIERDGKEVSTMSFISKAPKDESHDFAFFTERDLSANGKWKNEDVLVFVKEPFDYLISLDQENNKFFKHVLAASKAKCRVGCFEEDNSKYFELMINHGEDDYEAFLGQVYHYLTNMRNG